MISYHIFNKVVQFHFHNEEGEKLKPIILENFSLYEQVDDLRRPDLIIHLGSNMSQIPIKAVNPSLHFELENGFRSLYPKITVDLAKEGKTVITKIGLQNVKNPFIAYLKKLNNKQYHSISERIAQIVYELVLVPSIYFDNSKFLLHSSAFKRQDGGAILIGGTGGVGKTSIEIELCMNRGYTFIADDISVIDDDGYVWPNLSFPKIYAYNLKNNHKLKSLIFKQRPLHDKLAWKFKLLFSGAAGVRRTISPVEAYTDYEKNRVKFENYFILVKKNIKKLSLEKIDAQIATEMSIQIMQTEYAAFNNHILWHEFNCKALNIDPIIKLETVFNQWKKQCLKVLKNTNCYQINIPLNMDHKVFMANVSELLN